MECTLNLNIMNTFIQLQFFSFITDNKSHDNNGPDLPNLAITVKLHTVLVIRNNYKFYEFFKVIVCISLKTMKSLHCCYYLSRYFNIFWEDGEVFVVVFIIVIQLLNTYGHRFIKGFIIIRRWFSYSFKLLILQLFEIVFPTTGEVS